MESLCGCKIPDGHPLFVLYKENDAISKRVAAVRDHIVFEDEVDLIEAGVAELRSAASHYRKKMDVLYPTVEERDGFSETVRAMRAEDEEILRELTFLAEDEDLSLETWEGRLRAVLERMRGMIGKENNILFPLLSQTLNEEEWVRIYFSFKEYDPCFIGKYPLWPRAESPDAPRCACEL